MKGLTMKKFAMLGGAALLAVGASGCVTTGDLEEIRAMAEQAQQTADAADRKAVAAQSTASEANARAARAEGAAAASQKCCAANTERMNRMFEKSMQK